MFGHKSDKGWQMGNPRPPIFATGYVSFATTFLYQVAIATCQKCYFLTLKMDQIFSTYEPKAQGDLLV